MDDTSSVYDEIKQQKSKFSSMTKQQKIEYIKAYYMIPGIVALCVIAFALWFILSTTVFRKNVVCNGCTINVDITDESYDRLTLKMAEYLGVDGKKNVVYFSKNNYVNFGDSTDGFMDQTTLFTQVAAGEFNYMIVDKTGLDAFSETGYFADLRMVLGEDLLSQLGDNIIYMPGEGGQIPVAIHLKDTAFKCDAYLAISVVTPADLADKIVKYIVL